MNNSTKNKVLIGVVILLVALNITTLIVLGLKKPAAESSVVQRPRNYNTRTERGFPNRLQQELNFDLQQQEQYNEIREAYHLHTQENRLQLQEMYREMMEELSLENPDTVLLSRLAERIGQLHQEQQQATINHFLSLQNICTPDQYQMMQHHFMRGMRPHNGQRRGMDPRNRRYQRGNRPMMQSETQMN